MGAQLETGRAAYASRAWQRAYDALSLADQERPLDADDLEKLAWSAALIGRVDALLRALERLYHARCERDEPLRAARIAFWLGFRLFSLGEPARAGGWLGRAQRLIDSADTDCVERGYLLIPTAARHLAAGDDDAAAGVAADAVAIGEQFGDPDLAAFARNVQGRALIRRGEVEAGLALLDEAMLAVTSDELSPLVAGLTYCSVISTCQQIHAVDRSREWTDALTRWCDAQPELSEFTGACMVHRAELLQIGGEWTEALEAARQARERLSRAADPDALAESHYQQAEVHRMQGELDAAETSYRAASELGGEPQPGLALLRVAQGRAGEAVASIRRALDTTSEAWRRARFLPACVDIMLSAGQLADARTAADELEVLASRFDTDVLWAMSDHARGAIAVAAGDAQAAVEPLRRALAVWQRIGAPYIAARIRLLVARACDALGDRDGAALEREAAHATFDRLGVRTAQAGPTGERAHGLSARELEVLRLVATGKTNKTIAAELCLSERTIDRHVSNIFHKLEVSSRAAATAYAYEHGLI